LSITASSIPRHSQPVLVATKSQNLELGLHQMITWTQDISTSQLV